MLLRKKEIKLFIFFLILYSIFIHWIGWDESSSFALAKAIADEGKLEINNYINETGDRAYFNNNYYVSSTPGLGFISTPTFSITKLIFNWLNLPAKGTLDNIQTDFQGGKFFYYTNPGNLALTSMIALTILNSSLFGSLSVIIFYRILGFYTNIEKNKIILTLIYGLGSLVFPLSITFFRAPSALFLILVSFYFLKKDRNFLEILFSGFLLGFSVFIEYSAIIIAFFFIIFSFKYSKKRFKWFLLGIFLGVLPFFLYNYTVFNNPFDYSLKYLDEKIWPVEVGKIKSIFIFQHQNPLEIFVRLLFFPYRGLFFYYPIFLLSLAGFYYFYKKFKFESLLFALIFIGFLIANVSFLCWWGGTVFGPRHLILSIPFLIFPLTSLLEGKWKSKFFRWIFITLFVVSIFYNFLGLQATEGPQMIFNYQIGKYETLKYYHNPLDEYYLPLLLKNGLRSKILEGLLTTPIKIDIRDWSQQLTNTIKFIPTPIGFLTLRIGTLSIAIITLVVFLIWKNEIVHLTPKKYYYLLYVVFILIILLIFNL